MTEYLEFLRGKEITTGSCGFEPTSTNELLFPWQSDIVRWALKKGKACIFADCGLGKTPMQLQWAQQVAEHTGKPVLILAPLAVAAQTQREGTKFGIAVTVCRTQADVKSGVNITNYEMLEHFEPSEFSGVVLDESSILKHHTSKTRQYITDAFWHTPYKLCCTATPAPNDFVELGTHSEFMGVMTQTEMLSTFFVHDGGDTSHWRLKGHAVDKFFEWVASWACCLTNPADLGYEQGGFDLPPLNIEEVTVKQSELENADGQQMFFCETSQTLSDRRNARRGSMANRVKAAADIANATDEQVLIWCDLNAESEALTDEIDGAVEVCGAMSNDVITSIKCKGKKRKGQLHLYPDKWKWRTLQMTNPCLTCVFARMREDICGIYCTGGFEKGENCEHYKEDDVKNESIFIRPDNGNRGLSQKF